MGFTVIVVENRGTVDCRILPISLGSDTINECAHVIRLVDKEGTLPKADCPLGKDHLLRHFRAATAFVSQIPCDIWLGNRYPNRYPIGTLIDTYQIVL